MVSEKTATDLAEGSGLYFSVNRYVLTHMSLYVLTVLLQQ